ncbi:PREDICTED: palmitoyltransferase ZDHHC2-like, partial [Priapulus caudatus]|uniref:Palmitoyltransferase n=1 Tax=Priapulus caudatus TaxID=37621 RepID=A0ABM1EEP0_PRICU
VFISSLLGWSYYAYVVELCIKSVESGVQKALYLMFFHLIFLIFVWSYYQTIFTEPAPVPSQFYLSAVDVDDLENAETEDVQRQILAKAAKKLPILCRTMNGCNRYCEKCQCLKPDRSHHCSVCGRCILKMDHHCPWVNNCVNFSNYKFFVLFLGYGILYCLYVAFTSMPYFLQLFNVGFRGAAEFQIMFLFFLGLLFAISLVCLFGYHLFLTSRNKSTLESFRTPMFTTGPDPHGFNLGVKANFQEVFGDQREIMCLPIFTAMGDGVTFPTRCLDLDSEHLLGSNHGNGRWSDDADDADGYGGSLHHGINSVPPRLNTIRHL